MTIRDQLAPLIRERGISEVARAAGIHRPHLNNWLNGRDERKMTDERIERIARVLGVEIRVENK